MKSVVGILLAAALAVTVAVMATGLVAMFRGGEFNRKYGNVLMRCRVASQAVTVALLALWFFYDDLFM